MEAGSPGRVVGDRRFCETGRLEAASNSPAGIVGGSVVSVLDLYDASKCMAMMNSVVLSDPRCSVSTRFQIAARISLESPDISKDVRAMSPLERLALHLVQ